MTVQDLPAINATLNSLSAAFLVAGFICIKKGKRDAHRFCMAGAFLISVVFLGCYLYYHFTVAGVTRFLEPAWFKPIYLTLLVTHVILAMVIVPLIIMTFSRAIKGDFERHKKIARWTWPLWMYVSVTGVLVYLLLYQVFPQKPAIQNPPSIVAPAK